jgi:hypothetical protein
VGTDENPSAYHETAGFAVIAIVLVLEYGLGTLLIAVERRRHPGANVFTGVERISVPEPRAAAPAMPAWRWAVFLGLALLMAAIDWLVPPLGLMPQIGVAMELPSEVQLAPGTGPKFYGFPAPVTEVERTLLPKDTEFARDNYTDFRGHNVYFSIVLSGVQQFTIHRPEICLVGQGWVIDGHRDLPLVLASGHTLMVRNLLLHRQAIDPHGESHLIQAYHMYWYVTDGIATPSYLQRDWMTVWDRVFCNRDHRWAYIAVMSAITKAQRTDGLDGDQTIKMLGDFIRRILPSVQTSEMHGPG